MLQHENIYSLGEIAHQLPIQRSKVTLYRWVTKGVLADDGTRVKMEAVRVAGRLHTSLEAYQRFIEQLVEHGGAPV